MTKKEIKDVAASVRARLLNHARENGIEFNLVLGDGILFRALKRPSREQRELSAARQAQLAPPMTYRVRGTITWRGTGVWRVFREV